VAEEVLGIMELANKGTWFDGEWQAAIEDKNKAYGRMQQGYGTRSLIEKYKDKRRKEKTIHRRKRKEWINMELENMELLQKQHECRKFYKEINMARKQVKPRVNIHRNDH
jgi:arylamine N-acetyltransferase